MTPAVPAYSALDDEWEFRKTEGIFVSRRISERMRQRLIFNEPFRDGTVEATIKIVEREEPNDSYPGGSGAIVFRYQNPNNYYAAGIGGHGGRFHIGKWAEGESQSLVTAGAGASICNDTPFRVQVRCAGSRLTLSHNGITHLSISDDSFHSGPWGFTATNAVVEFGQFSSKVVPSTCFVIMPFADEFDNVYQVIHETVKQCGLICIRADERYVAGTIIQDVFDQIEQADLIIADLSGHRPNVLYEAGYAEALRKPVILLAQSVSDLPFDVRHKRVFSYGTRMLGDRKLAQDLSQAIQATTGFGTVPERARELAWV